MVRKTEAEIRLGHYIAPCPKCRSVMVIRKGPYGPFLACSRFPGCRHTVDIPPEWKGRL